MSPSDFTFKLTVPADPEGALVVAVVATHAVDYTNLEPSAAKAFVDRARSLAAASLNSATGPHCLVVFAAANGQLTVTIGKETVSAPLPS
jgi:hypothetical protein